MTEEVMNDVFEAFGGDLSNRIAVPITDNSLFGFDQNDNLIYWNGECVVRIEKAIEFKDIFTEDINNLCLKGLITDILYFNDNSNPLLKIFFDYFDRNGGQLNISFVETTSSAILYAGYRGPPTYPRAEIALNIYTLPNTSREFAASVILHEMVHAIIENTSGDPLSQEAQHYKIFSNWYKKIKRALVAMFPNLSERDALALSLGGLSDVTQKVEYLNTSEVQNMLVKLCNENDLTLDQAKQIRLEYDTKQRGANCE